METVPSAWLKPCSWRYLIRGTLQRSRGLQDQQTHLGSDSPAGSVASGAGSLWAEGQRGPWGSDLGPRLVWPARGVSRPGTRPDGVRRWICVLMGPALRVGVGGDIQKWPGAPAAWLQGPLRLSLTSPKSGGQAVGPGTAWWWGLLEAGLVWPHPSCG